MDEQKYLTYEEVRVKQGRRKLKPLDLEIAKDALAAAKVDAKKEKRE